MSHSCWTTMWVIFPGSAMFLAAGFGVSALALKNASPLVCRITSALSFVWFICLIVSLACVSKWPRWKAFSLTALLVSVLHLWLAKMAIYSGWEPTIATTAILDFVWHRIREAPGRPVNVPNAFGGSVLSEFVPVWEYFTEVGITLSSFWLGVLAGAVAFLVKTSEVGRMATTKWEQVQYGDSASAPSNGPLP